MKVKAIQTGYYEHKRRYEDDVFELKNQDEFSKKWMVVVEEDTAVKMKKPKKHGVSESVEQEA